MTHNCQRDPSAFWLWLNGFAPAVDLLDDFVAGPRESMLEWPTDARLGVS